MSLGCVFLVLAMLSIACLGVCHKLADLRDCKPGSINVMLFCSASAVFWGYTLILKVLGEGARFFHLFPVSAVLVAVGCGICACFAILTFQIGVRYGRISTSWLIINLSMLVPASLSLLVYQEWREPIHWQQPVALVLMIVSMLLLWRDKALELDDDRFPDN
jgi:hypothetical protein